MPPHVLIIDPDSERLEAIAALLEQEFDAVTHRYGTWRKFTKVRSKLPRMILAVLADGLVPPRPVDIQVYSLLDEGDPLVQNVVVLFDAVDGSLSGETDTRAHGVHVPTATAVDAVFRPACARVIPPPRLPIVTGPASRDPVLDYQIAALDLAAGDATRGETTLAKLIGRMWACPSAAVERLGQGYSGDLVLRVTTTDGTPSVLKVSRGASWTDRKHEADNWAAIEGALNEPYRHHVPELVRGPAGSALVEAGGFVALAFQFLGVAGTRFVDLERAYRDEAGCTAPARPAGTGPDGLAEFMVKAAVGLLRKAWYDHPQRRVTDSCLLWGDNEPSRAPVPGEPLYGMLPEAGLPPGWVPEQTPIQQWPANPNLSTTSLDSICAFLSP